MTTNSTRALHYFLALFVVAVDRWSKVVVVHQIPLYARRKVITGFFTLTHTENPGAAFSLFADSPARWTENALIAFSVVALSVVGYLLWKEARPFSRTAVAFSLIMGGALGNLWDRVVHGRVVDFLLVYVGKYEWPVFNLADSCIVIGAGLLALSILAHPAPQS